MSVDTIIKKIAKKESRDYTYSFIFFVVFSFFVLAVIRPNIITVFNLQKEKENLITVDDAYTQVISQIIDIQSTFETTRSDLYLLDQALPPSPLVNKLINDVRTVAVEDNVNVSKIDISQINLKKESSAKGYDSVNIQFEASGSFADLLQFITGLSDQRRLKTVNSLSVSRGQEQSATDSAHLNIKLNIVSYYL